MRIRHLLENQAIHNLSYEERRELLEFVLSWLHGSFMGKHNAKYTNDMWTTINKLKPPFVNQKTYKLYRLITIPSVYAEKQKFKIKPHLNSISSWALDLKSLDSVMGIAYDHNQYDETTARIAISALINTKNILATPESIGEFIRLAMYDFESHDGTDDFLNNAFEALDHFQNYGSYYKQNECIVKLPDKFIEVTNEKIYRVGDEVYDEGHDDPLSDPNF